jgi:hypothetical protein
MVKAGKRLKCNKAEKDWCRDAGGGECSYSFKKASSVCKCGDEEIKVRMNSDGRLECQAFKDKKALLRGKQLKRAGSGSSNGLSASGSSNGLSRSGGSLTEEATTDQHTDFRTPRRPSRGAPMHGVLPGETESMETDGHTMARPRRGSLDTGHHSLRSELAHAAENLFHRRPARGSVDVSHRPLTGEEHHDADDASFSPWLHRLPRGDVQWDAQSLPDEHTTSSWHDDRTPARPTRGQQSGARRNYDDLRADQTVRRPPLSKGELSGHWRRLWGEFQHPPDPTRQPRQPTGRRVWSTEHPAGPNDNMHRGQVLSRGNPLPYGHVTYDPEPEIVTPRVTRSQVATATHV